MDPVAPVLPTWEHTQQWLLTDGARILLTIVIAMTALWALRRVIDRVVATMTSRSARRLAESGRAGRVLASATGLDNERQRQRSTAAHNTVVVPLVKASGNTRVTNTSASPA